MKRRIFHLSLIVVLPLFCFAQRQGNIWYFAGNNGIDFNSGTPVLLTNGQIPIGNIEGTATISDSSGNLLFYATAEKIWNKNNQPMQNGTGLLGGESATQGVYIVPLPSSDSVFYVFTLDEMQNCFQNGLRYSVVNMCLDNGLGAVEYTYKNIFLLDSAGEKMAATYHSNGTDIWLIVHKYFSDAFYAYLITSSGIANTVISHVGSYHPADSTTDCWQAIGQMKISPDGNKLALVDGNASTQSIAELFDFDNNTGIISNVINLQPDSSFQYYGISFSPDNKKLYITSQSQKVVQYDLSSGIASDIVASKIVIYNSNVYPSGLQLGPDGRIYVVINAYNYLDVISYPNNPGIACGYVSHGFNLNSILPLSLPNFIDSYQYQNKVPNCNTNGVSEIQLCNVDISPNPSSGKFKIETNEEKIFKIEIYNIAGEMVFESVVNNSDKIVNLNVLDGIYFMRIIYKKGTLVKKIIIQQ
jgi:hypothetical protein